MENRDNNNWFSVVRTQIFEIYFYFFFLLFSSSIPLNANRRFEARTMVSCILCPYEVRASCVPWYLLYTGHTVRPYCYLAFDTWIFPPPKTIRFDATIYLMAIYRIRTWAECARERDKGKLVFVQI